MAMAAVSRMFNTFITNTFLDIIFLSGRNFVSIHKDKNLIHISSETLRERVQIPVCTNTYLHILFKGKPTH